MTTLNIAHFNDVYQVSEQKIHIDGKEEVIDVTKFASSLKTVTSKWADRSDGRKDGLIIFSGDLFSPSIESSVTRGRHMPPIVNALGVDAACAGNHEFDMGYPRLKELIADTTFPWLLSNIIDKDTGKVPEPMKDVHVLERNGVRIGFIGLVEKEWIATLTGWPANFEWQDYVEVGKKLSAKLRDPAGEYKCDIIFAITHCRISNDIQVARALAALSPSAQGTRDIASEHGVDLLLGGHDHVYWISKGATGWENYDLNTLQPDAEDDQGDTLIVKSGTDFQDLSEVILTLKDTPAGSIRKKVIQEIKGKRIVTRGETEVQADIKTIVDRELGTMYEAMEEPICITEVQLDCRNSVVRLHESVAGNWVTDCLRHSYDEALVQLGYPKTDGVIMNSGSLRGGGVYEPGPFTLRNLMTILPFLNPTVVIELSATDIFDAIENGLSLWPAEEGRFPSISGFRVSWDSRKPAGQRVLGIWLLDESKLGADGKPVLVDKEQILRTNTRKYLIMADEYLVSGGDGYTSLAGKKLVITAENGQSKSALIRKFLLGAQFLNKQLKEKPEARKGLGSKALDAIGGVENHLKNLPKLPQVKPPTAIRSIPLFGSAISTVHNVVHNTAQTVIDGLIPAVQFLTSTPIIVAALLVADHEDMGLLDCYERRRTRLNARRQRQAAEKEEAKVDEADKDAKKNLPVIHPVVDGRMKDVAGAA